MLYSKINAKPNYHQRDLFQQQIEAGTETHSQTILEWESPMDASLSLDLGEPHRRQRGKTVGPEGIKEPRRTCLSELLMRDLTGSRRLSRQEQSPYWSAPSILYMFLAVTLVFCGALNNESRISLTLLPFLGILFFTSGLSLEMRFCALFYCICMYGWMHVLYILMYARMS